FGFSAEQFGVVGTPAMGDEHNTAQLVGADQKVELFPNAPTETVAGVARQQANGAAGDGPAIVARDQQAAVAELVEGPAPAAVATVQDHRADALRVPQLGAGETGRPQRKSMTGRIALSDGRAPPE